MLCCAITETHLALGLPSGALHVYGIGGILDSMAALQARAVHTLTKTWRTPSSELLVEASDSLGSDGAPHSPCRLFRRPPLLQTACIPDCVEAVWKWPSLNQPFVP